MGWDVYYERRNYDKIKCRKTLVIYGKQIVI